MAAKSAPPDPASSPWLHLAGPLGKVGASFVIASSFAALFAPIVFLLNAESVLDPDMPASGFIALFSDPARVLTISDFLAILGVVVLAAAMAIVLLGLVRGDKPLAIGSFLLGGVVLVCLASWVPFMLYAQGTARGTISTVDAAAATGGWSLASLLLLVASLAYMAFTIRIENGVKHRRLTSFWWPAYGAVNVLGSVAVAGFFATTPLGAGSTDALSLGLVLKVTLIPMFGVMAYGDLKDRFPRWAELRLLEPATVTAVAPAPIEAPPVAVPLNALSTPTRKMVIPREPLTRGRTTHKVEIHGPLVTVTPEELVPENDTRLRSRPPAS